VEYEAPRRRDHARDERREPAPPPPQRLLALQRSAGNHAVGRLLRQVPRGPTRFPEMDPWSPPGGFDPPPPERDPIEVEYEALEPIRHYFEKQTLAGYRELRDAFLAPFGVEADGPEVAVQRALAYYALMEPVTFLNKGPISVHPEMKAALESAENALCGEPYELRSLYGVNIRFVRGKRGTMSDHSWGASIDVNGSTSPMTAGLKPGMPRVELIKAITGTDVTQDAAGKPMKSIPKTEKEMVQEATRLQEASDELVAAFMDEQAVKATAFRIAAERGAPPGGAEDLWALIVDTMESDPAIKPLTDFVFPIVDEGDSSREWDPHFVDVTVKVLVTIGMIWNEIEFAGGRDKIPTQAAFPSDVQLAVHGFQSIPPEVVGALAGSKAGNLKWLGTTEGAVKDYMHFDPRRRPARY
jgi:hypothetical protein